MDSSELVETHGAAVISKTSEPHHNVKPDPSQYVKLNVGGHLFYTTIATLTRKEDTMLSAMFSGRMPVQTDPEGWVLIDRSGKHFATILNYLRDGSLPVPQTQVEIIDLLAEAQYYCITELITQCELFLADYKSECHLPLVTSRKDAQLLMSKNSLPAVILEVPDQQNNAVTSPLNILYNIRLFENLAMRFNGRILFIKDIGTRKTLCWLFYNNGIEVAKVNCSADNGIQMREKEILQELLNIYEHRDVPVSKYMQSLSRGLASLEMGWLVAFVLAGILWRRYVS